MAVGCSGLRSGSQLEDRELPNNLRGGACRSMHAARRRTHTTQVRSLPGDARRGSGSNSQYVTVRNGSRCVDAGPGVARQNQRVGNWSPGRLGFEKATKRFAVAGSRDGRVRCSSAKGEAETRRNYLI